MPDINVSVTGNEETSAVLGTGSGLRVGIEDSVRVMARVGGGDGVIRVTEESNDELETSLQPDCCDNIDGGYY